jgi:hypothetical protein
MRAGQRFLWRERVTQPAEVVVVISVDGQGNTWGVVRNRDRCWSPEELEQAALEGRFVSLEGVTDAAAAPEVVERTEAGLEGPQEEVV